MRGAGRSLQRTLQLHVDIRANDPDDETCDALLDTIAKEVEVALATDPTLGGKCRDLWLTRSDPTATAQGEQRAGRMLLEFSVVYLTAANAPDVGI
jgi:hypothetical protein